MDNRSWAYREMWLTSSILTWSTGTVVLVLLPCVWEKSLEYAAVPTLVRELSMSGARGLTIGGFVFPFALKLSRIGEKVSMLMGR